jgi:spore coat polysaccharide biosynthesis predicted glycosyltransferase SpsG
VNATVIADAGPSAGLGHLSRTGAVAAALRSRGIEVRCIAWGADGPIERDGLTWEPLARSERPPTGAVTVLDTYEAPADLVASLAAQTRLALMHDRDVPEEAAIVTSTVGGNGRAGTLSLYGPRYACLRPPFWGVAKRETPEQVRRILIATGGGDSTGAAVDLAEAARSGAPGVEVAVLRGPYADGGLPDGITEVRPAADLLGELLGSDLIVTAGGQTLLEAAAAGTPAIAVVLAENQRSQAAAVADGGAAVLADPGAAVAEAASELAANGERRAELVRRGQELIDGFGALRVGFHIARLAEEGPR